MGRLRIPYMPPSLNLKHKNSFFFLNFMKQLNTHLAPDSTQVMFVIAVACSRKKKNAFTTKKQKS